MKLLRFMIVGGVLLAASAAFAQEGAPKTVYKKTTVVDFSDVTIGGDLQKPEGAYMATRESSKFNKLITTRENFIPEMMQSADNL